MSRRVHQLTRAHEVDVAPHDFANVCRAPTLPAGLLLQESIPRELRLWLHCLSLPIAVMLLKPRCRQWINGPLPRRACLRRILFHTRPPLSAATLWPMHARLRREVRSSCFFLFCQAKSVLYTQCHGMHACRCGVLHMKVCICKRLYTLPLCKWLALESTFPAGANTNSGLTEVGYNKAACKSELVERLLSSGRRFVSTNCRLATA